MFLSMYLCCYIMTTNKIMIWLPTVVMITLLEAWTKQIVLPLAGCTTLLLTVNTMMVYSLMGSS